MIRPYGSNLLVEMAPAASASRVVIVPGSKVPPTRAIVVAVGPGAWDRKGRRRVVAPARPGDTVLVRQETGDDFEVDGELLRIVEARDVLGTIER